MVIKMSTGVLWFILKQSTTKRKIRELHSESVMISFLFLRKLGIEKTVEISRKSQKGVYYYRIK